jgi:hypothetical protein
MFAVHQAMAHGVAPAAALAGTVVGDGAIDPTAVAFLAIGA